MLLLQLSSLREASHASGVFYPEVLNFVHNELVTDTSLWTDLVLEILYLCDAVHSCPSNPESMLLHGSTKMYSLFWDYTSAKSLWLVKHGMLLAPNLLLVTPGGSSPNLWESIAASIYWNLSGVLERCQVFLIITHYRKRPSSAITKQEFTQFCRMWSSILSPFSLQRLFIWESQQTWFHKVILCEISKAPRIEYLL